MCMHTQLLSCVWLFATPWTVALQAPLSMGFPGKNTGAYFRKQLLDTGIEPTSLASPTLAGRFFTTKLPGKPTYNNTP